MSLTTPTTQELSDNIVAQIETSINQTIPGLPKSFIRVLAKALAGVFILLYKYGNFTALQLFISTATLDYTEINGRLVSPLLELGRRIGVTDPAAATQAELLIDITVTNQTGSLPAYSLLLNSGNGVTYATLAAVALSAPTVQATVRAVQDQNGGDGSGTIGNLSPGAIVSFANPIANVARNATVNSQTITGADSETPDSYRARVLSASQARPQGGAAADYRKWGLEAEGIQQVYPYTGDPGEVNVYVESATETDGIPTMAQLDAVSASIELDQDGKATRRPLGTLVNTLAISRNSWTVTVSGLSVEDTVNAEADITTAVEAYFLSREPFITGLDVLPRNDTISQSAVIGVVEDIAAAYGGTFTTAVLELDSNPGVPVSLYVLTEGEKAKATVDFP